MSEILNPGGSFSRTQTDGLYMPQWPNLVAPPGMGFPATFQNAAGLSTLIPKGARVIVPKAGTLHDVAVMAAVPTLPVPSGFAAGAATGSAGTFGATGTYFYKITATNANGETTGSTEASQTISATTQTIPLSWSQVVGATGYKIYRATSAGGEGTSPALLTTIASGSTVAYTDTGTATTTGAVPGTNTANGNVALAVYDTGDAVGGGIGTRSLLWSSGALVGGASNVWQTADPALAVTAGQNLELLLVADNPTASFYRWTSAAAGSASQMPTGFLPVAGGAAPKLMFTLSSIASLTGWASTVTEGNVSAQTATPIIFARVA